MHLRGYSVGDNDVVGHISATTLRDWTTLWICCYILCCPQNFGEIFQINSSWILDPFPLVRIRPYQHQPFPVNYWPYRPLPRVSKTS